MFEVTLQQTFAAAHALRNYKGGCENLHGHNFKVQVVLAGERLDEAGLLVDFIDVKNLMGVAPFDVKNPSAENIAEYFCTQMTSGLKNTPVPVRILEVKVWETEIQSATYRP